MFLFTQLLGDSHLKALLLIKNWNYSSLGKSTFLILQTESFSIVEV